MSRTRRRKTVETPTDGWYDVRFARKKNISYKDVDLDSEEYKKFADWQHHKDTRPGHGWKGNVPKGYRKEVIRGYRAKDKAETLKILKKGIYEEYLFYPWKTDFGWRYW